MLVKYGTLPFVVNVKFQGSFVLSKPGLFIQGYAFDYALVKARKNKIPNRLIIQDNDSSTVI